jgi:hypothetical protein
MSKRLILIVAVAGEEYSLGCRHAPDVVPAGAVDPVGGEAGLEGLIPLHRLRGCRDVALLGAEEGDDAR